MSPFTHFSDAQLANLSNQLKMCDSTLAVLQDHGLKPEHEVRLDFAFVCPTAAFAEALRAYLVKETDYDLQLSSTAVKGTTQPVQIDAEIIKQWVFWMCSAGAEHGDCIFDGWGTAVPK